MGNFSKGLKVNKTVVHVLGCRVAPLNSLKYEKNC
jgi:hypothetical protein